ncbi:MAG: type II toxin-antitoxin system prevent-host-death family antitoxin, partial [Lentisphaeria bacterium]|nr:type II toxin-antitoxin system prevent-host-death family antitoxin [Lentisphaeria bacterium]
MKQTNVSEAKKHLSGLLREVENGESFLVMSRDRPIARIEPVSGSIEAGNATDRLTRIEGMLGYSILLILSE